MDKYRFLFQNIDSIKIKGITASSIKYLKKLGIESIYDLVYYFPKAYENGAVFKNIISSKDGENVVLKGKIIFLNKKFLSNRRIMTTANLLDDSGVIELVWFNNNFIHKSLKVNDEIYVSGKVKRSMKLQIINPSYTKTKKIDEKSSLEPIYSLTKGLTQKKLRDIIKKVIDKYGYLLQENIPIDFIYNNKIMSRMQSILNIHFPENEKAKELAIRRFTYEEIMILEMAILKKRYINDSKNSNLYNLEDKKEIVKKYIDSLNYEFTNSQKKVITSIYKELREGKYINRLIQGDVGSGKTIVAMVIMLYIAENSYQSVMMAPTEILASQHYRNIKEKFSNLGIRVELLTSSVKGKKKEKIMEDIKNGEVDIVIGTHSLLESNIEFKNLALSVIDEQHRFGVQQRNILREKSMISNILVMSATPIPRSLALTIYGDLDISIISEMPKGRQKVNTKWIKNKEEEEKMYNFIEKRLEEGQQMYIVAPLIETSDKFNAKAATETFSEIVDRFPKFNAELLHGKLTNSKKDSIMEEFKNKKISILVSTTVIEVGVDVSNANIIIIKSAERFGLSSLHQLRGRVGRGSEKAYCFLESETENEISMKRLKIMEEQNDGFKIAEEDLKLRNSGEIFGVRQSGMSDLVLLDIVKNIKEIEDVKEFVKIYLKEHSGNVENKYLMQDIEYKQIKGGLK